MYTRSRSSAGGPGFGNVRGQMNPGNANAYPAQNPYNPQAANYTQSAYKPGLIEPSAPFKPSGPTMPQQQQQAMKPRPPLQQQQPQQQQQQPMQQSQQPQQVPPAPTTPRLKPILKNSNSNMTANAAGATAANNALQQQQQQQPSCTPTPVPPPAPTIVPAVASATVDAPAVDSSAGKQAPAANEGDDPRWTEDDPGKWADTDEHGAWMDTEDGQQERPKWRRFKKIAGNKPNKRLKRLRMNQRLRKALMPKNAIMVLNEMKAGVHFTFPETQAIMPNSLFLVHAELEGKIYVGQGLSKPLARQNAAENALKCLLLEKMTAAAMKERVDAETESSSATTTSATPMETGTSTGASEEAGQDGQTAVKEENGDDGTEETDDVPWSSLASFALYKLFLEWQNQGTVVPIPRPGVPAPTKNRAEPKPSTEKQLPPNAADIHPVMLLNQMRPGTTYTEVGRVGTPPNIQFTLGVEINGSTYTGTAKNKKDAKKLAAKEALKALYNLDYPEEIKVDNPDAVVH